MADAGLGAESSTPAAAVIDTDRAPGPVALSAAADEAVARARAFGIAFVGVRRTVHTGALGYYVSRIADQGLAGLGFVAGMPNMGYTGAKGAAVATSPLAIAVPAADRPRSCSTWRRPPSPSARSARPGRTAPGSRRTPPRPGTAPLPPTRNGRSCRCRWAVPRLRHVPRLRTPHRRPGRRAHLLGLPLRSPAGREHGQNALLIALDPAEFGGGAADFTGAVDTTLDTLKGLPAAEDAAGVYCPGERGAAVAAERGGNGCRSPRRSGANSSGPPPPSASPRPPPCDPAGPAHRRPHAWEGGGGGTAGDPPPLRMR